MLRNYVSFSLFSPKLPSYVFFFLESFFFRNSFFYGFFEVKFGHGVGMDLTFFRGKLEL